MPNGKDNKGSWLEQNVFPQLMSPEKLYRLSPGIAAQKKQDEGITGIGLIDNFAGRVGSNFSRGIGDVATFVGANNVGNFFQSGSDWIDERLKPAMPAEASWNFISSPEGLIRGTGNTIGSMASILLPTAFIPGGAVGTIGRGIQAIPKIGKLFSSASPEMIGRWFASGIPEAAMEGGNWYRNSVANGMDPNEAWDKRWGVFGRNAAFLPVSNAMQWGLFSKMLGGKPILSGLGELGSQALEEGMQEAFTREVSGLPNTWNPFEMITNPKYADQLQAMKEGVAGFALPTLFGMGAGAYRNWNNRTNENSSDTTPTPQGEVTPSTGNETRGGNIFGVENYDMPLWGDPNVSSLKNGWSEILPQIGGVLKSMGFDPVITSGGRTQDHQMSINPSAPNSYHIIRDEGGDAVDISLAEGDVSSEQAQKVLDYFKGTGLFSEVLYHDAGSGLHLHLGGLKTGNVGNVSTEQKTADKKSSGIDNFMRAIVQQESGGDYDLTNPDSGAAGAFQIMPDNWSAWAQDAGLSADAPMTSENQNIVARHKMLEYYNKFGNWRDVAIAWYGGEGAVSYSEEAKNRPQYSNGQEYPSINEYADSVMSRFENFGGEQGGTTTTPSTGKTSPDTSTDENFNAPNSIYQRIIADILNEESPPIFNTTGDDDFTKNILTAFAEEKRDGATGSELLDLDSMFDGNGNFINSKSNRKTLANRYGGELIDFGQERLEESLREFGSKNLALENLSVDDRKLLSGVIKSKLDEAGVKIGGNFLQHLNEGDAKAFNKALAGLDDAQQKLSTNGLPEELTNEIARLRDEIKALSDSGIQASTKAEFAETNKQIKARSAKIDSIRTLGKDITKLENDLQAASDNLIKANATGNTDKIAKASDKVSTLQSQLDKKQSELQKILSPQVQDATPKTAPPANQQTADFMTNLDAQIQSLKAQLTPELSNAQVQKLTGQIQDATAQLDKINKLNAQIDTLTTQAAEAYQNLQNPEKQDAAIKQLSDATKKIQAAETELAKIISPQFQDATPEPSKKFAPVKAKADEKISTLNNQIDALRMQDETANADEIERLTDSRYAIQAVVDEMAELDAQFQPLIQARNEADKNHDAKAYNAAKRKVDALSKKYKTKSKELDKLLNPPQETPKVQEIFAPVNDEVANELASIARQKSELDAQGRQQNAKQITELNKRRDKIQAGNNELAKLKSQAESAESELARTTDVAKQNALKDQLASLYSKIDSKTTALSNFINPPQKPQKVQETFEPSADVQARIDAINARIRELRNSGEEKNSEEIANLSRQRDALQNASNELEKLKVQRTKAENEGNAQEVNRLTGKIAGLNNKINSVTQKVDKILNPPQKPEPKEKPQKPAKPVNRQTAQAISRLESDIERLDEQLMSDLSDEQYSAVEAQLDGKRARLEQIKTLNEEIAAAQKQKDEIRAAAKKARESGDEVTNNDLRRQFGSVSERQRKAQEALDNLVSEPVSDEVAEFVAKLNVDIQELENQIAKTNSRNEKQALLKKLNAKKNLVKRILDANQDVVAAREHLDISTRLGVDDVENLVAYEQAQEKLDKLINPPAPKTQPKVETQAEKKSPAKSKRQKSQPKAEQQESAPTETQKHTEQNDEEESTDRGGRIFSTREVADKNLIEAFADFDPAKFNEEESIEEDDEIPADKFINVVDDSDEALAREVARWNKAANKLSANAIFNPELWTAGLKIGLIHIQRGINKFAAWAKKMTETLGEDSKPWQAAIWETLKTMPAIKQFNDKQIWSIADKIGSLYEDGTTELEDIEKDFAEKLGTETTQAITPMIRASYKGIQKFFTDRNQNTAETKKAANKGEQDTSHAEQSDKDESKQAETSIQKSLSKFIEKSRTELYKIAEAEKYLSSKDYIEDFLSIPFEGLRDAKKRVKELLSSWQNFRNNGGDTSELAARILFEQQYPSRGYSSNFGRKSRNAEYILQAMDAKKLRASKHSNTWIKFSKTNL